MTQQSTDFFAALQEFEGVGPAAAPIDLCGTYKKVRPILQGILPILAAIPGFGPKVASAIEALTAALDRLCALPTGPMAFATTATPSTVGVTDQEFFRAVAEFQGGRVTPELSAAIAAAPELGAAAIAAADICGIYGKVKPVLNGVLPFLSLIPGIGKAVGAAIQALMAVLDTSCGNR